ncbi:hypothetical protein B0T17DRAFT_614934 [Bombardia bombarda]|uniref:Uncharacterized protein n=1 Tax=Bombardia bombarda TaxID=252184 RepID=A0AA39X8K6_9PEZI|nr:hypothetical protein B0T17DRAFT_614934 [Bombardia bombarda]
MDDDALTTIVSGSSSNSTTSSWFPVGGQIDLPGWRFDVITLLAVIGESSVAEHAQLITASSLCLLPRIIPAPQALLKPTRPQRLPKVPAKMAGVYGGTVLDTVGFFANIMHPLDDFKPFAFRVLEIRHAHLYETEKTTGSSSAHATFDVEQQAAAAAAAAAAAGAPDLHLRIRRAPTMAEKFTDVVTNPTMVNSEDRYTVPPLYYSPIHILSILSFLLTIGLLVAAGIWGDGTAILAIGLISLASSVVGYASWWKPLLMTRRTTNRVPPGDVVIRTREGAFIIVKCTEEVARELYSGTEECQYVSTLYHRAFMGLGMVLLMVSVVLLGNCEWNSQVLIGASYILLNGLYWVIGMLPQRYFWDLSRYECEDVTPEDAKLAHERTSSDVREGVPSFTRTLWYAIRETKRSAWVTRSGALPGTKNWEKWLNEAIAETCKGNRGWGAVGRKNDIMREDPDASSPVSPVDYGGQQVVVDEAEQAAPLVEIQPGVETAPSHRTGAF